MTNNIRVFLWLGLALALWVNYSQWQIGLRSEAGARSQPRPLTASGASKPVSLDDTVPQATQSTAVRRPAGRRLGTRLRAVLPRRPSRRRSRSVGSRRHRARRHRRARPRHRSARAARWCTPSCPAIPIVKGQPAPVVLFNRDAPATNYVLQTGLIGGKADDRRPTHLADVHERRAQVRARARPGRAARAAHLDRRQRRHGHEDLCLPSQHVHASVSSTRSTTSRRRHGRAVPTRASCARIPPVERSMFKVETFAFRGPAMWAPEDVARQESSIAASRSTTPTTSRSARRRRTAGSPACSTTSSAPSSPTAKKYDYTTRCRRRTAHTCSARWDRSMSVAPGHHGHDQGKIVRRPEAAEAAR